MQRNFQLEKKDFILDPDPSLILDPDPIMQKYPIQIRTHNTDTIKRKTVRK
jgi:hypothetical protein